MQACYTKGILIFFLSSFFFFSASFLPFASCAHFLWLFSSISDNLESWKLSAFPFAFFPIWKEQKESDLTGHGAW